MAAAVFVRLVPVGEIFERFPRIPPEYILRIDHRSVETPFPTESLLHFPAEKVAGTPLSSFLLYFVQTCVSVVRSYGKDRFFFVALGRWYIGTSRTAVPSRGVLKAFPGLFLRALCLQNIA